MPLSPRKEAISNVLGMAYRSDRRRRWLFVRLLIVMTGVGSCLLCVETFLEKRIPDCGSACHELAVIPTAAISSSRLASGSTQTSSARAPEAAVSPGVATEATSTSTTTSTTTTPALRSEESETTVLRNVTPDSVTVGPNCRIGVAAEPALESATVGAIATLNDALGHVELVLDERGAVSVNFGGDWPVDYAPLGWTDSDRQTILLNPEHPGSRIDLILVEIIAHELGHVLLGPDHANDGTLMDPSLDGVVVLGGDDYTQLGELRCSALEGLRDY